MCLWRTYERTIRSEIVLPFPPGSVTKTSNLANFYGGENLWPESGWKPCEGDKAEAKVVNGRGAQDRDLLASLAPEYAEIDSLGTFTSGKKGEVDVSAEAYACASVLAACNNRKNKVRQDAEVCVCSLVYRYVLCLLGSRYVTVRGVIYIQQQVKRIIYTLLWPLT